MPFRFTVLASGSAGNASLLEADGFGLLLDAGLGPRQLARRMAAGGISWQQVHAVLLTHTHNDHWKERTLAHLRRRGTPLYCHPAHHEALVAYSPEFAKLQADQLVRTYEPSQELELGRGLRCRPLPLRHDGGATFGFRFQATAEPPGQSWSLAYVADLGSWTQELARALADVDLLALEFNHDVDMEYASGRSPWLIARVLGDEGHLSNAQAAGLLQEVVRLSVPGRLRHIVQLHLSRDCNRSSLAVEAARATLSRVGASIEVHTASQDKPSPTLTLGTSGNGSHSPASPSRHLRPPKPAWAGSSCQPFLPGWES
jgi:phosphoribosyl 1,2-cyclic phosphodiesterase